MRGAVLGCELVTGSGKGVAVLCAREGPGEDIPSQGRKPCGLLLSGLGHSPQALDDSIMRQPRPAGSRCNGPGGSSYSVLEQGRRGHDCAIDGAARERGTPSLSSPLTALSSKPVEIVRSRRRRQERTAERIDGAGPF